MHKLNIPCKPDNDRIASGHADITKAEKIDKGKKKLE